MKKIFLFLMLLFHTSLIFAQKAEINNAYIETTLAQLMGNANSRTFDLHINFDVYDLKGKEAYVNVYFYDKNGNPLKDTNESYYTSSGSVATHRTICPGYESCVYSDFVITMPLRELEITQNGEFELNYKIIVSYNGRDLEMEGKNYNSFTYTRKRTKCPDCKDGRCSKCNGTGTVYSYLEGPNGVRRSYSYSCGACYIGFASTGGCRSCWTLQGRSDGYIFSEHRAKGGSPLKKEEPMPQPAPTPTPYPNPSPSPAPARQKQRVACSICSGTGIKIYEQYSGDAYKWCSICRKKVVAAHLHVRCDLCGGKGYNEY